MKHINEKHLTEQAGHTGCGGRLLGATAALLTCCLSLGAPQACAADAPLVLEKSMTIPGVPVGPYSDVLSIDVAGGRIFATPQAAHAVAVLDLKDGHVLKMISGIGKLHAVFYSPTLKRLFVTDAATGDMKVFNGEDYSLIKTIPLSVGADALAYDPNSQLIYVNNGGTDAGMDHALVSVVEPVRMEKVADIPIAATDLEGSVVDPEKQLLYVALVTDSAVAVVDLRKRQTVGTWKLPPGKHFPFALEVDAAHNRLYVVCRENDNGFGMGGAFLALDTHSGRAVARLPIGGWVDGISLDKRRQRFYISTGVGRIETYAIGAKDVYRRLADVEIPLIAKHSLYSSELDRLYVDVPHLAGTEAQVAVFKPLP
jgi:hypothetical protein